MNVHLKWIVIRSGSATHSVSMLAKTVPHAPAPRPPHMVMIQKIHLTEKPFCNESDFLIYHITSTTLLSIIFARGTVGDAASNHPGILRKQVQFSQRTGI
jgi:hypothetical protein